MYYQLPPRKRAHSYLLPFLVIMLMIGFIIFVWWGISHLLIENSQNTLSEKVFLNIEEGSAKAMTVGNSEWQNAPDKIYLYRGEGLKTGDDGRATLTFFDQSIMRTNTNTEVSFASLKKKPDSFDIQVDLKKGDVWTKVERITNPDSKFSITTDMLTIDTRGAVLSITAPSTVYLLQGNAQIGVKYNDEVIKTYTLGVGQQFQLDPSKIDSIRKGDDVEAIFAMSDQFRQTDWYHWNAKKDGMIDAFEESGTTPADGTTDTGSAQPTVTVTTPGTGTVPTVGGTPSTTVSTTGAPIGSTTQAPPLANMDRVAYVTKPTPGFATNKSSVSLEGNYDADKVKMVYVNGSKAVMDPSGKWTMDSVRLPIEGDNKIKLEAEDMSGVKTTLDPLVIVYDKTPPPSPVITDPKADKDGKVAITSVEQLITGTVSDDTQSVIVNDYALGKYVPGSKTWQYYAKVGYGNLVAGDNEFKVIAEDKAGNQSDPATIVLTLDQSVIDAAGVKAPATPSDNSTTGSTTGTTTGATTGATTGSTTVSLPKASATGGVTITAPNNGESFQTTDTEFEIDGTVPDNTAKVTVNDYALSLFTQGTTTFKYRAYKSIGNLSIGKQNTYTVKAYDSSDTLLGQASITIDVQSGASSDPVITMPTDKASYDTTLDTVVVGGTVGKWVTRVFVNDKELTDYIPGSEKWSTSVTLKPGKNDFTVSGEMNGTATGKATITINYQQ
jgi:FecR protein